MISFYVYTIYFVSVLSLFLQLEIHVRDDCPATEVQCEYENLGCEAVV